MIRFLFHAVSTVLSLVIGWVLFLLLSPFSMALAVIAAVVFGISAIRALFFAVSKLSVGVLGVIAVIVLIIFFF